jgi:hypothetical protein
MIMRRSQQARLMWGAKMAQARENARLARAARMAEERMASDLVGQFLVLGFDQAPRLVSFHARGGRVMRARDEATGLECPALAGQVWRMARLADGGERCRP